MAKFKKASKKKTATGSASAQAQAERLSGTLSESAQQIWLAGVGAFGRAQAEGTKLFEALVKEGLSFEQTARKFAGGRAEAVRDAMENRVGHARERAADTWDKLEKVFEDRVQRALTRLGVPGRDDLNALIDRVDELNAQLRKANGSTPRAAPRKQAAKPAVRKTAVRKAPVRKAPVRKKAQ
ncbi:poly(hydroxyalkanoate) granule-associated protein [Luteimonas cucumeris]|uniref:Poly(Hydroxyalkanoate) granule-associated protein n=1 Tax=Luteimonas cucumeris TaxID=985012 RepID=A0A562L8R9_9GAMM|nr:phasin family protein [Luteimonas cucumeris]TWI03926.1 poly(hydroxyalkanoate) granule-associated protein [Luteimonas cucumeris]